ncbi:hypothetical protein LTR56_000424 [Elasticomyces elasticus]|nr:hypothetical protein LTR56_000424 [Elasticomyces elasticus]KAK3666881.1 hypothetical protein LTR22_002106 [Elasticomyces elasticus]KAK4933418.1 hypothetical protein LTR49_000412 [Elasticomyces elasticus]KAK5755491.1 hypothetical protein LTS12_014359 [Elasticomyces elasticus]
MLSQLLLTAVGASLASAHFILEYPPTARFIDDSEPDSPCGGATVTVNSTSPQVQVDQFAISIMSTHPQGEWQFRATTDTQPPYNFTDIVPVVNTTGIGSFCLNSMSAPGDFAGKPGIIQVIDNSIDGQLYQCAPVNFVAGSNTTLGSACTNATGFTATWTSLESINGTDSSSSDSSSGSMTMTGMASSTAASAASGSASASASSSAAAAMVTGVSGVLGGLGMLAAGLIL